MVDNELPRGVYYEAARKRYRVRIYKNKRVVHLSYHKRLNDALNTWHEVQGAQPDDTEDRMMDLSNIRQQIETLRSSS